MGTHFGPRAQPVPGAHRPQATKAVNGKATPRHRLSHAMPKPIKQPLCRRCGEREAEPRRRNCYPCNVGLAAGSEAAEAAMRRCGTCERALPIDAFPLIPGRNDGRLRRSAHCAFCAEAAGVAYGAGAPGVRASPYHRAWAEVEQMSGLSPHEFVNRDGYWNSVLYERMAELAEVARAPGWSGRYHLHAWKLNAGATPTVGAPPPEEDTDGAAA